MIIQIITFCTDNKVVFEGPRVTVFVSLTTVSLTVFVSLFVSVTVFVKLNALSMSLDNAK